MYFVAMKWLKLKSIKSIKKLWFWLKVGIGLSFLVVLLSLLRLLARPILAPGAPPVNLILNKQNCASQAIASLDQINIYKLNQQLPATLVRGFTTSLRAALRLGGRQVRYGIYRVDAQTTIGQLWWQLYRGQVTWQAITIIEGWTIQQALAVIAQNPDLQHTLTLVPGSRPDTSVLMQQLGYGAQAAEGRFAPETYYLAPASSDRTLLKQAYQQMERWLQEEWAERSAEAAAFYNCPYQALIVASLLEKEIRQPEELPWAAGVILTRLRKNMHLNIDASVLYGLRLNNRENNDDDPASSSDNYYGQLTRKQIATSDSAYNSYRYRGLPPTPICLPGRRALHAALHPQFGFLYYTLDSDGKHHLFSRSLEEHNRAVQRVRQLQQRKDNGNQSSSESAKLIN